ncbi:MAG: hypothetical protein Q8O94_01205 [bacterium]|nr:hypothetical protein [bacterium]
MKLRKIKMQKTFKGSEDGTHLKEFIAGVEYDMETDLARVFVEEIKCAKYVLKINRLETTVETGIQTPKDDPNYDVDTLDFDHDDTPRMEKSKAKIKHKGNINDA